MKVILMQRIKEAYQYILISKKEKLIHNIRKTYWQSQLIEIDYLLLKLI